MAINLSDPDFMEQILVEARKTLDETVQRVADNASPPVDTGFLQNSVYINSARVNTFDRTWGTGTYSGKRGPQRREQVNAPVPYTDENMAIVGWAAIYAWHVEDSQPFAYPALLQATA